MCGNKESDTGQWQERDSSPGVGTIYTMAFDLESLQMYLIEEKKPSQICFLSLEIHIFLLMYIS